MNDRKNYILAAMFLTVGLILPFFTGQIPQIGKMLLPMHIPVFLCGLICGSKYGLVIGFILPLMRSMMFTAPMFYPTALAMAFELAAYGCIVGFLFTHARWQCIRSLYRCLLAAMIGGRVVWGFVMMVLLGFGTDSFTIKAFLAGGFFNAIPGIVLQLVLIPSVMLMLHKTHLVPFRNPKNKGDVICGAKG